MINLKLFLIILVLFFQGCDNFKRFGQEKYTCLDNNLSIYQIDIIKTSSIKQAYMITNDGVDTDLQLLKCICEFYKIRFEK